MNTSQSSISFKPSKARYFLFWWIFYVLGYQIFGFVIYLIIQTSFAQANYIQQQLVYVKQTWWVSSSIFAAFWGVALGLRAFLVGRIYRITITDEVFEGRDSISKLKIAKPLHMIDQERTMRKRLFNKLFWHRKIWFRDGQSFVLHEYAFPPNEVRMILEKIGCG